MTTPKICVAGVGGVGCNLAAVLGRAYGENVSLIARGKRAESFCTAGVRLHSDFYGEITFFPRYVAEDGASLGVQDVVFVCVKNYSLDGMAEKLAGAVGTDTVIVPVMNGTDAGDRLRALFPDATVGDSLIYTLSGTGEDFSVTQKGPYTHLFIGSRYADAEKTRRIYAVYELLKGAGFDARWSEDIESEIWQKYILNCAYNTVTALHHAYSGDIRRDDGMREELHALLWEAARVGFAEGVNLPEDIAEQKYHFVLEKQPPEGTSSMRRDLDAGRPLETDAFTGSLIRRAERLGIDVPVSRRCHAALEKAAAGA